MGTGKSRAARILADGLDWQLADTDRMMEKDTGMRIAEYYQSAGPDAFTAKEKEIRDAHAQLAAREQQVYHLEENFRNQKARLVTGLFG